jgi:hypothetical protein
MFLPRGVQQPEFTMHRLLGPLFFDHEQRVEKTRDLRQKTQDLRQKTQDSRQKTKDRRLKTREEMTGDQKTRDERQYFYLPFSTNAYKQVASKK